jgi:hypothetical protein
MKWLLEHPSVGACVAIVVAQALVFGVVSGLQWWDIQTGLAGALLGGALGAVCLLPIILLMGLMEAGERLRRGR